MPGPWHGKTGPCASHAANSEFPAEIRAAISAWFRASRRAAKTVAAAPSPARTAFAGVGRLWRARRTLPEI